MAHETFVSLYDTMPIASVYAQGPGYNNKCKYHDTGINIGHSVRGMTLQTAIRLGHVESDQ